MQLTDLLAGYLSRSFQIDIEVKDLALDSRKVKPGDLFFALPGSQTDGERYLVEAMVKQACAILKTGEQEAIQWQESVPIITLPNLLTHLGSLAAKFFGYPSRQLTMIGVTGTNGKTSCCYFLAQALTHLNKPCAIIGTLGYGFIHALHSTGMTTPDAITLQRCLKELVNQGAQAVVMEVSSHALMQHRVAGIDFEVAVFTNLTQDHLDYHGTMENYALAKRRLLHWPGLTKLVINYDDPEGRVWLQQADKKNKICLYAKKTQLAPLLAANSPLNYIVVKKAELSLAGMQLNFASTWGDGILNLDLLGQFNVSNLLAVMGVLGLLGFAKLEFVTAVKQLINVPGRMQCIRYAGKPLVIVDFAHTPDALEQVLTTLKAISKQKLICVFGCGGNRDRAKRPLMAAIAERYADLIVVTSDNPRNEDPQEIVTDIVQGFIKRQAVYIELDREKAIWQAIRLGQAGDMVLIAGKGHETIQIIKDKQIPFDDVQKVKQALQMNP